MRGDYYKTLITKKNVGQQTAFLFRYMGCQLLGKAEGANMYFERGTAT